MDGTTTGNNQVTEREERSQNGYVRLAQKEDEKGGQKVCVSPSCGREGQKESIHRVKRRMEVGKRINGVPEKI